MLGAVAVIATPQPLTAQQKKPPVKPAPKTPMKPQPAKPAPDSAAQPAVPAAAPQPMGAVTGTVFDSVHNAPLRNATVSIEGTAHITLTNSYGIFRIDSVPPGTHRVRVDHELLDSIGIQMLTEPFELADKEEKTLSLSMPSGETLVNLSCPPARRALGPAAIIGRLLDADRDTPIDSARVSFAWSEISLQTLRRVPRVREAFSGRDGVFRICGLPNEVEGTLQAFKGGVSTAEVRVTFEGQTMMVQGLKIGSAATVTKTESDSAERRAREAATGPMFSAVTVQRGAARLTGRVVNANGGPVANARVDVVGTPGATLTRSNGEFALDSLPSGTQSLVVRQIGYAPVEQPIELSVRAPARVTVVMAKPAQVLNPVVVTAEAAEGLDRVGFTSRKKSSGGTFITAKELEQRSHNLLTDVFRTVPGLRVVPVGSDYQVESSRSPVGGCVSYYVDGAPFEALYPGDVDRIYPIQEIAGIEVYQSGNNVPAMFQRPGASSCAVIVIWSKTSTTRYKKR